MENIYELVKKAERNLIHGKPIKIGKYATHDHVEKISMIDAYVNSQHISGKKDSLGREKPFFNIVLMAAYAWYKTTDLDRKDINFSPAKVSQRLKALVATIMLRAWMKKENFGAFLNKWGWNLAVYGSAVSKFIEKEGKLTASIVPWNKFLCDPVDFKNNIKIEKLYFTPAQLRKQPYDEEKIEEAIKAFQETRKTLTGEEVDIKNEYIGIYEVHGELPLFLLTDNPSHEKIYRQQMHVIFIEPTFQPNIKGGVKGITLYKGKETKDPYHISHLIEQEGRTLSIGAVESLFDPQWMVNHSVKQVKDQLDLASKLITQTSDPQFLGRNLATDVDTGSVLIHSENQPLTTLNNQSHDIPSILNFLDYWKQAGKDISGAHETITGEQMKAGTPYRLGAMLNMEARGLYDLMRENKGLYLEEIMRTYVLPYFKKKLKNSDEVVTVLDGEDLENFDELTLPAKLQSELMARLSMGHIPSKDELMSVIEEETNEAGVIRAMKPSENENETWADYFKDFDMDAIEIDITGESRDKQSIITTLDSILQRVMANPQALQDPNIKKILSKILDEVDGLSPLHLVNAPPIQEGTTGGMPNPMQEMGAGAGKVGAFGQPTI